VKKVLIAIPQYGIGGFGTFAMTLGSGLRARGYSCDLYCNRRRAGFEKELGSVFSEIHYGQRALESPEVFISKTQQFLLRGEYAAIFNSAVTHVQAAMAQLQGGCRLSVIHAPIESELVMGCSGADRLSWIVAVSENIRRKIPPGISNVKVIPVGFGMGISDTDGQEDIQRRSHDQTRIAYLGRLCEEQKRISRIVEIARMLRSAGADFRFEIGGEGKDARRFISALKDVTGSERVRYWGVVARGDVKRFWTEADVCLLTSDYEGTPHAILEAMASGAVPVVARLEGSTDQMVEEGRTGFLIERSDIAGYARAILTLAADRTLFGDISARCGDVARASFSGDLMVERYLSLIDGSCVGEGGQTGLDPCLRPYLQTALRYHAGGLYWHLQDRYSSLKKRCRAWGHQLCGGREVLDPE